jgi:ATP-binding cassette subfamily B protein
MNQDVQQGTAPMRRVFTYISGHWARQRPLAIAMSASFLASALLEILIPVQAGRLIDALALGAAGRPAVVQAFATMAALGLGSVGLFYLGLKGIVHFTPRIMRAVTQESFHRVQRLSTDWHANSFAGSVVRKISRGMWAVDAMNDVVFQSILPALLVLVGSVALLAARAPVLGALMAAGAIAYVGLTILLATRWIAPASRLSQAQDTRIGGMLADAIGANAVVKAFAGETREDHEIALVTAKWERRVRRTWLRHVTSATGQIMLLWVVRLAVTGAALLLWWQGRASAGDVAYVITAYLVVQGYLREIGHHVHVLQQSINEMEEMVLLHAEPPGIADAPGAAPIAITHGAIRFDSVRFHYAGQATPLYDGLSVAIPAGQRVGLVGRSGSGKTSFVKLIQRLHDVDGGAITIDGQDVAAATQQSLRQQIAIVPQEPILFHRSLADNVAYARPQATLAEIEAAARLANAHDFIAKLPKGYRTLVGERGVKLSGGERQRVALARAFLADAPILILDEATSSLDSESETLIQQAIARLMAGRTAILIAHRLSTVRDLDRILVFDHGRIVEDGDHASLLALPEGQYRRLHDHQSGSALIDGAMEPPEPEEMAFGE